MSGHITQFVGVPPGNYYVCAWYTDTSQTPNKTYYVRSALKAVGTYASVPQAAVTTTVSLSTGSPTTPTSPC